MKLACAFFSVLSFAGIVFASPVDRRDNPDAKTYYLDMVDNVVPGLLKDYNRAIDIFAHSSKTPEDIDELYHASYLVYPKLVNMVSAISYVDVELLRKYPTGPEANRTVFASVPKLQALIPPTQAAMTALSKLEANILAHGKAGHYAIFSSLVAHTNTWKVTSESARRLAQNVDNRVTDTMFELSNIVKTVREQYNREGYCQGCYPF